MFSTFLRGELSAVWSTRATACIPTLPHGVVEPNTAGRFGMSPARLGGLDERSFTEQKSEGGYRNHAERRRSKVAGSS